MDERFLSNIINCLSLLEKETAEVYKAITEKTNRKYKALLLYIYLDTSKHYQIFNFLSNLSKNDHYSEKNIDIKDLRSHCKSELGEIYNEIYNIQTSLKNRVYSLDYIDRKQLLELLEELKRNEAMIEETYSSFILRLLMEAGTHISTENLTRLLIELIEKDEEKHNIILEKLRETLIKEDS